MSSCFKCARRPDAICASCDRDFGANINIRIKTDGIEYRIVVHLPSLGEAYFFHKQFPGTVTRTLINDPAII